MSQIALLGRGASFLLGTPHYFDEMVKCGEVFITLAAEGIALPKMTRGRAYLCHPSSWREQKFLTKIEIAFAGSAYQKSQEAALVLQIGLQILHDLTLFLPLKYIISVEKPLGQQESQS